MKQIIVPTDFSVNADYALSYARMLAEELKLPLRVIHLITPELTLVGQSRSQALEKLNALVVPSANESISIGEGDFLTEMAALTSQTDLVVMGTKGASGLRKILIGSNTVQCIEALKSPMIVVPEQTEIEPPRLIIHSADLKEVPDDNALDALKLVATAFHAEVRIVHFRNGGKLHFGEVMEKRREQHSLEPEVKVSFRFIDAPNAMDGLAYYLDHKPEANMVSVVKRAHAGLRWFVTDHVKEMAYHTRIPLLVLREGEFIG